MECPIGLECIVKDDHRCINQEYCSNLARPLPLPYDYYFDIYDNCWTLAVNGWSVYEQNTVKDLKELGWNLPVNLFYDRYFDKGLNCWVLQVVYQAHRPIPENSGWSSPYLLPYDYVWDKELDKAYISVHYWSDEILGFNPPQRLPYKIYKHDFGRFNVLEVTRQELGWYLPVKDLTFETSFIEDGKYKTFQCHTVVQDRKDLGFLEACKLPYKKSKKALTVTKTLKEEGFMKAIPIEPPMSSDGLIVIKGSIYFCFPENLRTKTQLKKLKLKLSPEQKPKAYYETRHGFYDLFDIEECEK